MPYQAKPNRCHFIYLTLICLRGEGPRQRPYFCSALAVACYTVTGVIGDIAQLLYKPEAFSPADLHEDPTFGWFLGYITADRNDILRDDPLLTTTNWRDAG
jgi:hypothetical protein